MASVLDLADQSAGKFRHAEYFEEALVSDKAGKYGDGQTLNLVFSLDAQGLVQRYGVVERYEVLERYAMLERYELVERYEYEEVFDGFAVSFTVRDGESDFLDLISTMIADPDILWFEPDFEVSTPQATGTGITGVQQTPWSVAMVGGTTSPTKSGDGTGNINTRVFILDSGIASANTQDPNDDLRLVQNVDYRPGKNDPADYDGHGTHIAGIIGAIDDSDGLVGLAPGALIHNMKVLDDDGRADASVVIAALEDILQMRRAHPHAPMVVNMSLGEDVGTSEETALDDAVRALARAGVFVVVAAGNQGTNAAHVTPARVAEAFTVGSFNLLGQYSDFSNYGSVVDILAPGEDILSLDRVAGHTRTLSGTSMATAHVSGAIAMALGYIPTATPAQIRRLLLDRAGTLSSAPAGTTNKTLWVGEGHGPQM